MEVGGNQGSRLTGRMFCIMMDLISEELSKAELGFTFDSDLVIAVLLWVDDVMTCVESIEDQKEILLKLEEFASKHKLQWSKEKCNIMGVGKHKNDTRLEIKRRFPERNNKIQVPWRYRHCRWKK